MRKPPESGPASRCIVPSLALSTDNAAMIAAAGLRRYHAGVRADEGLNADASLALTESEVSSQ